MPSKKNSQPCYVLGVGMTKFIKPRGKVDYHELGFEAGVKALLDAQINYDDVEQGFACYCYGDSTCGQRVFYQFGMTSIPIVNVNNNCSTGSTGLYAGRTMVSSGAADCVMVLGFEKMSPGSLQAYFQDRTNPTHTTNLMLKQTRGVTNAPGAAQLFGNAGRVSNVFPKGLQIYIANDAQEYMEKYGATAADFAEIARINHAHSAANPYSQFRDVYTLDQVLSSPTIHAPLTKLQCCPTSDGAAAAILVSEAFLDARPHLRAQAIRIAGQAMRTDSPRLFSRSAIELVGYGMGREAGAAALAEAQAGVDRVRVCELHDCFSANEMVTLDALGLSGGQGRAHDMVRRGDITHGGRVLVNPSGGLISKGHPLGATGLAQCAELVWQLRGWANNRLAPVQPGDVALQHNLGLGGAAVVSVYVRSDGKANSSVADDEVARLTGLGYNPATTARGFTREQVDRVRSKKARSEWALQDTLEKVESRF